MYRWPFSAAPSMPSLEHSAFRFSLSQMAVVKCPFLAAPLMARWVHPSGLFLWSHSTTARWPPSAAPSIARSVHSTVNPLLFPPAMGMAMMVGGPGMSMSGAGGMGSGGDTGLATIPTPWSTSTEPELWAGAASTTGAAATTTSSLTSSLWPSPFWPFSFPSTEESMEGGRLSSSSALPSLDPQLTWSHSRTCSCPQAAAPSMARAEGCRSGRWCFSQRSTSR
mmetsp:Transcript_14790/g.21783  ORF Transcript_14790/g.21783 Transcript_14790/m.21783 type:complete len:223 (-) Transcript_14790:861-1529(-)